MKLASYVHVDGKAYGPEDYLPPEVAARIDNPAAWVEGESTGQAASRELELQRKLEVLQEENAALRAGGVGEPPVLSEQILPPPMGGAGSGLPEWLAYAGALGVEVPEESREKRDDVIEVLRAAGKPVERTPK